MSLEKILVSACLLGQKVRYDGGDCAQTDSRLRRWGAEGRLIAICPETAGGLPVPRPAAELAGGTGEEAWSGLARVRTGDGEDVTDAFTAGGRVALAAAREAGAKMAVLKANSPSCGNRRVYDGSFSGRLVEGQGVTAALLARHGLAVFNEHELDAAADYLRALESNDTIKEQS